ncbi:multidrug efflux transporter AcrB transmembrane domain-containing protein [Pholiota conissans]|uniref:Multidrug efflux transporter AcrB transmembrane domain-containing protein n=1 Tax=Pholiota conissans TaxID=109636 RepID=A0A9P5ZFB2_9AGAR|nr:multidrug efflux transporter AcrB transmembrane domain-containing protein [Pholiota conissans]
MATTTSAAKCAMRGSCGRSPLYKPLPCPYDGPPLEPDDKTRQLLGDICGEELLNRPICCTSDQLETLRDNFEMIEPLIGACPACRNNFRSFFCTFTCSPEQSTFLNITSTQKSTSGEIAVKTLDFYVADKYGEGFFDSCKEVQYGNTNGYAMDFIGGGAKNATSFLRFLGDKKDLGSPFQINFPLSPNPDIQPLDRVARKCADDDLLSRCTCIDCPDVCPSIPPVSPPNSGPTCHVGQLSCLSFILILTYSIAVVGFLLGYLVQTTIRKRRERRYERVALATDAASPSRTHVRGLVGAGSLAQNLEEDSLINQSESRHLGRGASLLDPIDTVQPRQYPLNTILRRGFYKLGLHTASSPFLTSAIVFLLIGLLNIGWKKFEIETDPVRLWVSPSSESKQQKEYFDEKFGPFYRTEQIFVMSLAGSAELPPSNFSRQAIEVGNKPPVLSWHSLKYWFNVESEIRRLNSSSGYTLHDVCFKPAGNSEPCVVQSIAGWFGNSLDNYNEETWSKQLQKCAHTPTDCLPDFKQPLGPQYVLGGIPLTDSDEKDYLNAEALVITYVVSDSLDPAVQAKAMEWEEALKDYLTDLSQRSGAEASLEIAFSTGVSLEEEINKSTNTDVKIVILSYLAMFFYISLTLGSGSASKEEDGVAASLVEWGRNFPKLFSRNGLSSSTLSVDSRNSPRLFPRLPRSLFVGSKFTLGLFGILLVILSVSSSVGLFSFLGVKVTLIIAEVIPFLVLAVGVDNVFILVHELDRQNFLHGPNAATQNYQGPGFSAPMSPTNSHRSPFDSTNEEIDASSLPLYLPPEERIARTLARMGPSILLSTITETVAFGLGALVPMPAVRNFALYAAGSVFLNATLQVTVFMSALLLDLKRYEANRIDCFPCVRLPSRIALVDGPTMSSGLGRIGRFIRRYYVPFLLKPLVKGFVLVAFSGVFVASVISMQHIQLGLDERLALPSESYLVNYFDNLDAYLDVGPPVYFVARDIDVTQRTGQRALCGRFSTCDDLSVANRLEAERKRTESSFIAEPSASWIDDFLRWLNPSNFQCCRVRKADTSVFCGPRDRERLCQPCYQDKQPPWNVTMDGLPEDEEFMRYFRQWWNSPTSEECPLAGKTSFGTAIALTEGGDKIEASHFRTFHSPLKNQQDLINAFAAAHRIAEELSEDIGTQVFPYSLFYVFFDQYAHIVAITQEILGLGLAAVLIVTACMLGSWRTGSIVTGVVALTVVTVMGVMPLWNISLNAISLVNLVISLGIAVEFCAHVARAFMSAGTGLPIDHPSGQKERDERMWTALVDVGPSVLSGITFTKLIGMSVLALTRSKLLEIYYFRMWLTLIISGALHGLVLLPVVLSLAGGSGFPQQEADEEWMSSAIRNDYEYAPFIADDESISSD